MITKRATMVGLTSIMLLCACDAPPTSLPPSALAQAQTCATEPVRVRIDNGQVFWNGEMVDDATLAKRAASHWCGGRPFAISLDQPIPDPRDHVAIAHSMRVGRLIVTGPETLTATLKQLAEGSY